MHLLAVRFSPLSDGESTPYEILVGLTPDDRQWLMSQGLPPDRDCLSITEALHIARLAGSCVPRTPASDSIYSCLMVLDTLTP